MRIARSWSGDLAKLLALERDLVVEQLALTPHGDVLPDAHAERAGDEAGHAREHDDRRVGVGPGHAHDEREVGDEAVVGPEHHRAQDGVERRLMRPGRVRQRVFADRPARPDAHGLDRRAHRGVRPQSPSGTVGPGIRDGQRPGQWSGRGPEGAVGRTVRPPAVESSTIPNARSTGRGSGTTAGSGGTRSSRVRSSGSRSRGARRRPPRARRWRGSGPASSRHGCSRQAASPPAQNASAGQDDRQRPDPRCPTRSPMGRRSRRWSSGSRASCTCRPAAAKMIASSVTPNGRFMGLPRRIGGGRGVSRGP